MEPWLKYQKSSNAQPIANSASEGPWAKYQTQETKPVESAKAPINEPSNIASGYRGVEQGVTLGLGDEIKSSIGALYAKAFGGESTKDMSVGDLVNQSNENQNKQLKQDLEVNPTATITGNVVGSLLTGGVVAGTKAGGVITNSLRAGGKAERAVKSVGAGVASGGLYGATTGENGSRVDSAIQGAKFGALAGAVAPVVANALSKAASPVIKNVADRVARKGAQETGEVVAREGLSKAEQKVYDRLRADFPNDADFKSQLNSYFSKQDQSLIEVAGERTKNLAEGASTFPTGSSKAVEFFNEATGKAPDNIKSSLSKAVSNKTNYNDTLDEIVDKGREKASPLYKEAYKRNQSVSSPLIDKMLETPQGKASLSEAVKDIQNEMGRVAVPDNELTDIAKTLDIVSKGGVASGLKLKTLDYVKRGMDKAINQALKTDANEAGRLIGLKKDFVAEVDRLDKSGLYAKARKASGDYLSNKEAMDSGLNFLKEDPEIVKRLFNDFGTAEKEAYRVGVLKTIRNDIDNKIDGRNVTQLFSRPATRDKLKSILSEKDYNRLASDVAATDMIYKLRNQLTGNSRTALRQNAAQEFDNEGAQIVTDIATRGAVNTAIDRTTKFIARQFNGLSDKLSGEVADILYETDPKIKYQIVKKLTNEANNSTNSLRKTEAANQLQAYYTMADKISQRKSALALPAGAVAGATAAQASKPLQIDINKASGTIPAEQVKPAPASALEPRTENEPQSDLLNKIAQAESGGNPNAKAKTSSASGLFQFTNSTWNRMVDKYGDELDISKDKKNDPQAQARAAQKLAEENTDYLLKKIGRQPTDGEIYIAHFLGAAKASAMINKKESAQVAAAIFPKEARANRAIFYHNGKPRSIAQVYELLTNKVA